MVKEISTPIVLEHSDIVPGSERVSVKGASIPALIKDSDYIIDYKAGEIRFLADGAAVEFSDLIEQFGVDVVYSYKIDFTTANLFESQVEVFDEVATRVSDFSISIANGPLFDVSRILNLTTQEEYIPESINEKVISFSGNFPPRLKDVTHAASTLQSTTFDVQKARHVNLFTLTYPQNLDPKLNPTIEISEVQSLSTLPYLLVIGGEEVLSTIIQLFVPLETVDIQLITGGRTLRTSTIALIPGTDYTFALGNTLSITDYKQLSISLTATGVQKIRTNSLYMSLAFTEVSSLLDQGQFQTITHHVNEIISFDSNDKILTKLPRQVDFGVAGDVLTFTTIQVVDPNTGFMFEEHKDYELNLTQSKITKLPSGRIVQNALIYYIEKRTLTTSYTLVQDVVLVDYIWTNNALNWDALRKQVPITQIETLKKDTQFVLLNNVPLDESSILIYLESDFTKTPLSRPISFNANARRLTIQPIPADGVYVLEYLAISQPINEGSAYFVSYKYGASRSVLKNKFARLVGINETQTEREEVFALSAGATTTQLSRSPTSLTNILIFSEGDAQETPISTAKSFDSVTRILTFTSISKSGRVVFRYLTNGFDTKSLRKATQKLFESFPEGPTLTGFQNIISGFVDTPADITSGLTNRFLLPDKEHSTGNPIALKKFESSPLLSDGQDSVTYLPSRFNLGALFEATKGSHVKAPTSSNIGLIEGTLEFLTGVVFNPNDGNEHYFVDVAGSDPRKNRFSIYKSKNNKLNFDIWDNEGQLFRASADVNQVYNTEIINLKAGDNKAVLSFNATPALLDLNSDGTPDLYQALETKFIIMPETPTFPSSFKKTSIKVLAYDATTRTITFEPVDFSGRYIFSYVGGLVKFEETENFIAATWKLHTYDGEAPYYRLYINGRRVINQTLQNINFSPADANKSSYDVSKYDIDVYED